MNNLEENLCEEYTSEKAVSLSVKFLPSLTKNMSKNPLSSAKRRKDVFLWKDLDKEESSSEWSEEEEEMGFLPVKPSQFKDVGRLRRRSRSLSDNEDIKKLVSFGEKNKVNQDIKMLLQEAIRIRKISETNSVKGDQSWTSGVESRFKVDRKESEIRVKEDLKKDGNEECEKYMKEDWLITVGDLPAPINQF